MNKDIFAEVRTLGNLADIYSKQDSLILAEYYYQEGLELAKKEEIDSKKYMEFLEKNIKKSINKSMTQCPYII